MRKVFFALGAIYAMAFAQFSGIYEVYRSGQLAGTVSFAMSQQPLGYFITTTFDPVAQNGAKTGAFTSQTYLDPGYHPTTYKLQQKTSGAANEINAVVERGVAKIKGSMGINSTDKEIPFASTGYILDQENWGHLWVLGYVINPKVGNIELSILVPQTMLVKKLALKNEEERKINDRNVTIFSGTFGDEEIEMWVSSDKHIVMVKLPTQKLEVKLAEIKAGDDAAKKIPANYNPLSKAEVEDKDFIKNLVKVKKMKLEISFDPKNKLDRLYLQRRAQTFTGSVEANALNGIFDIKKMSHRVTLASEWPMRAPFAVDPEYTSPAPGIDSDDPTIIERAKQIVEPAPTIWEAARAISIWTNRNIKYERESYGAKDAVQKGKGDSHTKALVCASMLRAVGLPARVVRGMLMLDVALDHSWVEVYLGQEIGWAPMDPTTDEVDELCAAHVSLWLGEDMPPILAKEIITTVK